MKRLALLLLLTATALGQEKITLDAPILADVGSRNFGIAMVTLNWESPQVAVKFREVDTFGVFLAGGRVKHVLVTGNDAAIGLKALEVGAAADFRVTSFKKKLVAWLQLKGYLGSGAITGEPAVPTTSTTTTLPLN